MLKKTVTYEDWNGNEQTETLYFNLTRTEMIEMEYGLGPGKSLTDTLNTLIQEEDMGEIIHTIKDIVLKSYGVKSEDGKRFVKNDEVREAFEQSPAFDEIYMELATEPERAAEFLSGIMPKALTETLGDNPKEAILSKMKEYDKDGAPADTKQE